MDEEKFFSLLRQFNELKKLDPEESDMLLDSMKTIFIFQKGKNTLT